MAIPGAVIEPCPIACPLLQPLVFIQVSNRGKASSVWTVREG